MLTCLVLASVAWTAVASTTLRSLEQGNASLRLEIGALEAIAGDVQAFEALSQDLERRLDALASLRMSTGWLPSVLRGVEGAVPEGVWLTSLEVADGRLDLQARSTDPEGAANLMEALQASPCFDDVALRSVEGGPFEQEIWLQARVRDGLCEAGAPGGRDLFLSPALQEQLRPRAQVPALLRWQPRQYELVGLDPGVLATLRDPEGGLHGVGVGHSVGSGRAVVAFVTDATLVLTEDHVVEEETRRTETSIITLTLTER